MSLNAILRPLRSRSAARLLIFAFVCFGLNQWATCWAHSGRRLSLNPHRLLSTFFDGSDEVGRARKCTPPFDSHYSHEFMYSGTPDEMKSLK